MVLIREDDIVKLRMLRSMFKYSLRTTLVAAPDRSAF